MIGGTVCAVVLSTNVAALFYPPGTVSETFRVKMFDLLLVLTGICSAWLFGGRAEPPKVTSGAENPPTAK